MTAKKRKSNSKKEGDPFQEALRLTLNAFDNPDKLEATSPLVQPYFLGEALAKTDLDAIQNTTVAILQSELLNAAETLWGGTLPESKETLLELVEDERRERGNKGSRYLFLVLELRYFRQFFKPHIKPVAKNEQGIIDFLGVGRSPFFRHLKTAREQLGNTLLQRIRPSLRLEQPPKPSLLFNREATSSSLLSELDKGNSVSLSGASGTGKTALVANAISQRPDLKTFWYTLKPGVNMQVDSLLFSLGSFVSRHGFSSLWLQLIADNGEIKNFNVALSLLRGDLSESQGVQFLFCFDEVEHLIGQTMTSQTSETYARLRTIIDTLAHVQPHQAILIGQTTIFKTASHVEIHPFSQDETLRFFQSHSIEAESNELDFIQSHTGGIPRILNLIPILHKYENSLQSTLESLNQSSLAEGLFNRVWSKISAEEQLFMSKLAVYDHASPSEIWPPALINKFLENRLVNTDTQGGVYLIPFWRKQIYFDRSKLPVDNRERFHLEAATTCSTRGEYTEAARHLINAGEPEMAVHIWFPNREAERRRGLLGTAHEIFAQLSSRRLPEEEQKAFALIRAELEGLAGNTREGLEILEASDWGSESIVSLDAAFLKAKFQESLGYPEQAIHALDDLSGSTLNLFDSLIKVRGYRVYTHLRLGDLKQAENQIVINDFESSHLKATLEKAKGNFEKSAEFLKTCLQLAEDANFEEGLARTYYELSEIEARTGNNPAAIQYIKDAIQHFKKIGNIFLAECAKTNLAGICFYMADFDEAIKIYKNCLSFFQKAKMPYWVSISCSGLADSYYELGDLVNAKKYAQMILQTEEAHASPFALFTLGRIDLKQNNTKNAKIIFTEGLELARQYGDRFIEAFHLRGLGETAQMETENAQALEHFTESLNLFKEMGVTPEVEVIENLIAGLSGQGSSAGSRIEA